MSREAQAERERRARVTLAVVESEAAQKMLDTVKVYEEKSEAMTLGWMNIFYEMRARASYPLCVHRKINNIVQT